MKARIALLTIYGGLIAGWISGMGGCSTAELTPNPAPAPSPPPYVQVPHPAGFDLGDLRGVMASKLAPSPGTLKTCDSDYGKLLAATKSEEERKEGVRELIRRDPAAYHWCFYGKVLELEEFMKNYTYVDERQAQAIKTYSFLVPIARAFMSEYHDSRYLRWAVLHYRRLSEYVFFRRLELSPQGTSELVQIPNPFGLWRDPETHSSVLEKYNIVKPQAAPSSVEKGPSPASVSEAPKADPNLLQVGPVAPPDLPPPPTPPAERLEVVDPTSSAGN